MEATSISTPLNQACVSTDYFVEYSKVDEFDVDLNMLQTYQPKLDDSQIFFLDVSSDNNVDSSFISEAYVSSTLKISSIFKRDDRLILQNPVICEHKTIACNNTIKKAFIDKFFNNKR